MKLRDATQQLNQKNFHTSSFMYFAFFLRIHQDNFFQRGFETVRVQFVSGNIIVSCSVSCNLSIQLRFIQVNFLHVQSSDLTF